MNFVRVWLAAASLALIGCGSPALCSPFSCAGCCDSAGACQSGTQVDACGAGASRCAQCPAFERCSTTSKACGPCGPANCSGCCTSDGRCIVEVRERDTYCGFNGNACVDCAANSKTCSTVTLACQ